MTNAVTGRNALPGLLVLNLMAATDTENGALIKRDDALVGAVVSAAVGVAAYGLRKALAGSGGLSLRQHDDREEAGLDEKRGSGSLLSTVLASASDSLLPLAEEAAEMAGKWAAKNSPALIRERLVPRFIDSFKAAA